MNGVLPPQGATLASWLEAERQGWQETEALDTSVVLGTVGGHH